MNVIRRLALPASLAVTLAVFGLSTAASADPGTIVRFDTMAPVTGPYVGAATRSAGCRAAAFPG